MCWSEQEEQEELWLLEPKVEELGSSSSTATMVRQVTNFLHVKIKQAFFSMSNFDILLKRESKGSSRCSFRGSSAF